MHGWTWRRGFVEAVDADTAPFLTQLRELLRAAPLLREATLRRFGRPRASELLAVHPGIRRLRALTVDARPTDPDTPRPQVAAALLAPTLAGLEALTLLDVHLGDAGLRILAAATHLTALRALSLGDCRAGVAGLTALAAAPLFRSLTALSLSTRALDAEALAPLFAHGEALTELRVTHLGDDGLAALAASPALARLEVLAFPDDRDVTARGIAALAASPHLRLRELDARASRVGDAGLEALAASPGAEQLTRFVFGLEPDHGVTARGLLALLRSPHLRRLEDLPGWLVWPPLTDAERAEVDAWRAARS
ncbi:MAG: hypothetical protein R3F59_13300 [Myxococcota bacterium]